MEKGKPHSTKEGRIISNYRKALRSSNKMLDRLTEEHLDRLTKEAERPAFKEGKAKAKEHKEKLKKLADSFPNTFKKGKARSFVPICSNPLPASSSPLIARLKGGRVATLPFFLPFPFLMRVVFCPFAIVRCLLFDFSSISNIDAKQINRYCYALFELFPCPLLKLHGVHFLFLNGSMSFLL